MVSTHTAESMCRWHIFKSRPHFNFMYAAHVHTWSFVVISVVICSQLICHFCCVEIPNKKSFSPFSCPVMLFLTRSSVLMYIEVTHHFHRICPKEVEAQEAWDLPEYRELTTKNESRCFTIRFLSIENNYWMNLHTHSFGTPTHHQIERPFPQWVTFRTEITHSLRMKTSFRSQAVSTHHCWGVRTISSRNAETENKISFYAS